MTAKDYVTADVAILLKEKGYTNFISKTLTGDYNKTTLYEAQQWLREIHRIEAISCWDYGEDKWFYAINSMDDPPEASFISQSIYGTYEAALNIAIKDALKYIGLNDN